MKKFFMSFKYAWSGIVHLFANERNAKFHLVVALLVGIVSIILGLTAIESCIILLCIGGVFAAEGFNTAIEKLADRVSIHPDPLIKTVKDVAAGAVLLFVIFVVIVGCIIFIPKLMQLLSLIKV